MPVPLGSITITSVVANQVFFETARLMVHDFPLHVSINKESYVFDGASSPALIPPSIYNPLLNTGFSVRIRSRDGLIESNFFIVFAPLVPLAQPGIHFLLY